MLGRLHAAGVRGPAPHAFSDGVLAMECVRGLDGAPAPRLGERGFDAEGARLVFDRLLREGSACWRSAWSTATCRTSTCSPWSRRR